MDWELGFELLVCGFGIAPSMENVLSSSGSNFLGNRSLMGACAAVHGDAHVFKRAHVCATESPILYQLQYPTREFAREKNAHLKVLCDLHHDVFAEGVAALENPKHIITGRQM